MRDDTITLTREAFERWLCTKYDAGASSWERLCEESKRRVPREGWMLQFVYLNSATQRHSFHTPEEAQDYLRRCSHATKCDIFRWREVLDE
jgi:hypothetical protein